MKNELKSVESFAEKLIGHLEKVIVGKRASLELMVLGLLSQGHILIEDVPGVGKTVMARSLAKSLGCKFNRIQFTPDMLPSDVTGVSIFNQRTRQFEFRPGPLMVQIILADEINRATPKTQSALLEGMEEKQITVDGVTHPLPKPFMVMATQNPIEYEGTFPLPEAQLDRFLMRIRLGYPSLSDEIKVLERLQYKHPLDELAQIISVDELLEIQEIIKTVYLAPSIKRYIIELVRQTRNHSDIYLGSSPRGGLGLFRTSQARAAIYGRHYVLPDDIKALSLPVLTHRVVINPAARLQNLTADEIIQEIVNSFPVPGGDFTEE
jgi:MoxR-like ATPase